MEGGIERKYRAMLGKALKVCFIIAKTTYGDAPPGRLVYQARGRTVKHKQPDRDTSVKPSQAADALNPLVLARVL
jgi:hypothetical protein